MSRTRGDATTSGPQSARNRIPEEFAELRQRIEFIRYSIADIVARGEWDDFGLFRLVNRVSFVALKNLVFIVFSEDGQRFIFREFVSTFDPKFNTQLIAQIQSLPAESPIAAPIPPDQPVRKFGPVGNRRGASISPKQINSVPLRLEPAAIANFKIQVLDSKLHLVVFELGVVEGSEPQAKAPAGREPRITFTPVRNDSPLGLFLTAAFEDFDGGCGRALIANRDSEKNLFKLVQNGVLQTALDRAPEDQYFGQTDLEEVNRFSKGIRTIISSEYKRLSKSPILYSFMTVYGNDVPLPTNAFFFSKVFCRQTTRYDHYFYDPIFVICEEQRARFINGFTLAKEHRDDFIPFGNPNASDAFWQLLTTPDGPEHAVRLLKQPLSSDLRLFPENVLMSGSTMVKPRVFDRSGLGWLRSPQQRRDAGAGSNEEGQLAEWLRLACLHYALQMGSPKKPIDVRTTLSLVTLPMRCSGGIWLAGSYTRVNSGDPRTGLLDKSAFEINYMIYHSLFRESERRLRRRAKRAFAAEIGNLLMAAANDARISGEIPTVEQPLSQARIESINQSLINLTRLYPFPLYQFADGTRSLERHRNPFFDRLSLRTFLHEDEFEYLIKSSLAMGYAGFTDSQSRTLGLT